MNIKLTIMCLLNLLSLTLLGVVNWVKILWDYIILDRDRYVEDIREWPRKQKLHKFALKEIWQAAMAMEAPDKAQ